MLLMALFMNLQRVRTHGCSGRQGPAACQSERSLLPGVALDLSKCGNGPAPTSVFFYIDTRSSRHQAAWLIHPACGALVTEPSCHRPLHSPSKTQDLVPS